MREGGHTGGGGPTNRTAWVYFDKDALTALPAWYVMEAGGANAWFMTEIEAAAFARQYADEVVLANNIADRADPWRSELERATGQRWLSVPMDDGYHLRRRAATRR